MRIGTIIGAAAGTAAAVGAGVLAYRALQKRRVRAQHLSKPLPKVRDAGPDAMKTPPKRWNMVDEQSDESFPASDPPGNY